MPSAQCRSRQPWAGPHRTRKIGRKGSSADRQPAVGGSSQIAVRHARTSDLLALPAPASPTCPRCGACCSGEAAAAKSGRAGSSAALAGGYDRRRERERRHFYRSGHERRHPAQDRAGPRRMDSAFGPRTRGNIRQGSPNGHPRPSRSWSRTSRSACNSAFYRNSGRCLDGRGWANDHPTAREIVTASCPSASRGSAS